MNGRNRSKESDLKKAIKKRGLVCSGLQLVYSLKPHTLCSDAVKNAEWKSRYMNKASKRSASNLSLLSSTPIKEDEQNSKTDRGRSQSFPTIQPSPPHGPILPIPHKYDVLIHLFHLQSPHLSVPTSAHRNKLPRHKKERRSSIENAHTIKEKIDLRTSSPTRGSRRDCIIFVTLCCVT